MSGKLTYIARLRGDLILSESEDRAAVLRAVTQHAIAYPEDLIELEFMGVRPDTEPGEEVIYMAGVDLAEFLDDAGLLSSDDDDDPEY